MVKVNILWASMFGTAEDVANDVHEKVKDKGVEIFEMNDFIFSPPGVSQHQPGVNHPTRYSHKKIGEFIIALTPAFFFQNT